MLLRFLLCTIHQEVSWNIKWLSCLNLVISWKWSGGVSFTCTKQGFCFKMSSNRGFSRSSFSSICYRAWKAASVVSAGLEEVQPFWTDHGGYPWCRQQPRSEICTSGRRRLRSWWLDGWGGNLEVDFFLSLTKPVFGMTTWDLGCRYLAKSLHSSGGRSFIKTFFSAKQVENCRWHFSKVRLDSSFCPSGETSVVNRFTIWIAMMCPSEGWWWIARLDFSFGFQLVTATPKGDDLVLGAMINQD